MEEIPEADRVPAGAYQEQTGQTECKNCVAESSWALGAKTSVGTECVEVIAGEPCFGATCPIETRRGIIQIGQLRNGDYVKTLSKENKIEEQIVFYIREHDSRSYEAKHLDILFDDDTKLVLTINHMVYDKNNELITAGSLQIGDSIKGSNAKILEINEIMDIPLTPTVTNGNIIIHNKVISCFSNSAENVHKMNEFVQANIEEVHRLPFTEERLAELQKMSEEMYINYRDTVLKPLNLDS
jgi:hypothetical protein